MLARLAAMAWAVALAFPPVHAFAEEPQILAPGALVLAGAQVQCGLARTIVAPIDDIAMTYPGYIVIDPRLFTMPAAIQHFWYAHECAHQLFGFGEKAADCWAIQAGKQMGWFRADDFEWMDANFIFLRGSAKHLPGPKRLANLKSCYAKAPPHRESPRQTSGGSSAPGHHGSQAAAPPLAPLPTLNSGWL